MKKISGLVIVVLCLALLFVTNPTSDDFSDYVARKAQAEIERGVGDSGLGKLASGLGNALAGFTADVGFTRNNYFVFSTFEAAAGETVYLGFGKMVFIKLK